MPEPVEPNFMPDSKPPEPPKPPRKGREPELPKERGPEAGRIIRKTEPYWDWTGRPETKYDAYGVAVPSPPQKRPSRSLWIRHHLKDTIQYDYPYRMWKQYIIDMKLINPDFKECSYNDFLFTVRQLVKLPPSSSRRSAPPWVRGAARRTSSSSG
jgi:hypothetical protein